MSKTAAAKIWASVEPVLIAAGLSVKWLHAERPRMIRLIGDLLGRAQGGSRKSSATELPTPTERLILDVPTSAAVPARLARRAPEESRATELPAPVDPLVTVRRPRPARRVVEESRADDTTYDPRLAQLLDRACSRRTGYEDDDVVDYGAYR